MSDGRDCPQCGETYSDKHYQTEKGNEQGMIPEGADNYCIHVSIDSKHQAGIVIYFHGDESEEEESESQEFEELKTLVEESESFDYPHGRYKAVDMEEFLELVGDE